ncbi:MAG TPA: LuxR C-terminal-related transcriptional regulator [Ktedonobacterales bacterium]|nr:LuxR C-terminal-related transcriptional regulator [Ktedonobacterales bacterium]
MFITSNTIALERLRALERVLTLIETCDQPEEAVERWTYLASAYYWMADFRHSYDVALRRAQQGEQAHQPHQLAMALAWLAWIHASQGSLSASEQALEQAIGARTDTADTALSDLIDYVRALLAAEREHDSDAEQTLQTLLAHPQNRDDNCITCAPLLSVVFLKLEKRDEARRFELQLQSLLAKVPPGTLPTLPIMLALAFLALARSEQALALELYQHLLAFHGYYCWFLVDRVLGLLATNAGNWDAAAAHLASAEATARRERLLPELARTLIARADLEEARGNQDSLLQASTFLGEALDLAEKLAMPKAARELRSRLGLRPCQPEKRRGVPLPAGLTAREVDVLRLVAAGKSNGQIAKALSLSEKTVGNHLTTIFHKTISENRAAAAAFAIRHGLA